VGGGGGGGGRTRREGRYVFGGDPGARVRATKDFNCVKRPGSKAITKKKGTGETKQRLDFLSKERKSFLRRGEGSGLQPDVIPN